MSTRVLPEPAPASTSTGPTGAETAARWASLSEARIGERSFIGARIIGGLSRIFRLENRAAPAIPGARMRSPGQDCGPIRGEAHDSIHTARPGNSSPPGYFLAICEHPRRVTADHRQRLRYRNLHSRRSACHRTDGSVHFWPRCSYPLPEGPGRDSRQRRLLHRLQRATVDRRHRGRRVPHREASATIGAGRGLTRSGRSKAPADSPPARPAPAC